MCTCINLKTKDYYFGRNLDLEYSYEESITIASRNFPLHFREVPTQKKHYAIIGMAYVKDNYPLYYDATNEKGLSMAGLNFPDNAYYPEIKEGKENVSPFELIPYLLGQCATVWEAKELLAKINLAAIAFSDELPLSPLHWLLADEKEAVTLEATKEGLSVYENPIGVLTNNPPFPIQIFHLNNYLSLSVKPPYNTFSDKLHLKNYSRGMGALGLPGDLSSSSRFVRAAFTKLNSVSGSSESESLSQFFHILNSVSHSRGLVEIKDREYEITVYSSCCNTTKGIYYYTTYENSQITGIDMHMEDINSNKLISYPLLTGQRIYMQNNHV